jgi:hypothetical protein
VQVRCLGYTDPYEIPNNSKAEAYIKNAYICLNLAENKIMPRHDVIWNTPLPGGLSNVTHNDSNSNDNITSADEEYDYDLLFDGPPKDYSDWQGEKLISDSIPDDPDGIPLEEAPQTSTSGVDLATSEADPEESDPESEQSELSPRKKKGSVDNERIRVKCGRWRRHSFRTLIRWPLTTR